MSMSEINKIKYSVLSECLMEKRDVKKFVRNTLNLNETEYKRLAQDKIDRFVKSFDTKYKKQCHFKKATFHLKNRDWLNRDLLIGGEVLNEQSNYEVLNNDQPETSQSVVVNCVKNNANYCVKRKKRNTVNDYRTTKRRRIVIVNRNVKTKILKPFTECSERTKRRRCEKIRSNNSEAQINDVFMSYLRNNNRSEDAKIIEKLRFASPDRKQKILDILNEDKPIVTYTSNEALALMIDANLSKHQYELIQQQAKSRNANLYPPYYRVLEAKKECYPVDGITITDTGVDINLQDLLDHTVARLLMSISEKSSWNGAELFVHYKWGFDGASGQSQYKQTFSSADACDKSVVMTSLVPLQIRSGSLILWQNPQASSTRFCRPIAFEFMKEDKHSSIAQYNRIKDKIKLLKPTQLVVNQNEVNATHSLSETMVDGKVVDHLSDTSTSNCNICNAKPTQMNNFEELGKLTKNEDNYKFGLSTLHCWIRFLECMLHIAYRIPIQRTDARGKINQEKVADRKKSIQNEFRAETGLLLDFVKTGSGTTNDGNSAREFFKNPKLSAKITGLNEDLINRFRVILICLSSGRDVDIGKFKQYALETADVYELNYKWYKMPPSVHKVLFHGSDIIESLNLPIGLYSEEAAEARNKDFKRIREHHTRKIGRIETNMDLIHGLLVSSDPVISSLRTPFNKPKLGLDDEVIQLLKSE